MIGFLSFISKIDYASLPCLRLFFSFYFIQVLLIRISSAIRELFTDARQHIKTRLVFSADCTEGSTLSQAHIYWLELRCGSHHIFHNYLTSISQALTSQYLSALTIGVSLYTSN